MKRRDVCFFIQPFGLNSPGGGARILRSLLEGYESKTISVCTASLPPPTVSLFQEQHLPFRPWMGRIETTRLAALTGFFDVFFKHAFQRKLERLVSSSSAALIHVIPHSGLDFESARVISKKTNTPLAVSIHDHPAYCFKGQSGIASRLDAVGRVWKDAAARFVISREMGLEMERLYGAASWDLASDGLEVSTVSAPKPRSHHLQIYFMGLFHHSYRSNLVALLDAVAILKEKHPNLSLEITLRCGSFEPPCHSQLSSLRVLPFANEKTVENDMERADLLYLPLPFGTAYSDFVRYSVSTKMITYLGSSRPILYHGPEDAAAGNLLKRAGAAIIANTNTPMDIASKLASTIDNPDHIQSIAMAGYRLGHEIFSADKIRANFWNRIQSCLHPA